MPKQQVDPTAIDPEAQDEHRAGFTTLEQGKGDAGQSEIQAEADKITEQGFVGVKTDPRDNEEYTLRGVAGGTSRVVPDKGR